MKMNLIFVFCLLGSLKIFGQTADNSFIEVVKKLKPISTSNDYLRFGAQIYSAKIYLTNRDPEYTYEITYPTHKGTKKAESDQDYYNVNFMALPGGKQNDLNQFEKEWKYNVRIFNSSHDTTLLFESNYIINLPIVTYNINDTLIAYRNLPTTLNLDFPLYKNFLIDRKIYFYADSADIIRTTDTSITFIPRISNRYLKVRAGAGGNYIFSKIYRIIEAPKPQIISPDSILSTELDLQIRLEPSDEFKHLYEGCKFEITNGKILILRNSSIISEQKINNHDLNEIKRGDTILIHVTECERMTFDRKKEKMKLNQLKIITVR